MNLLAVGMLLPGIFLTSIKAEGLRRGRVVCVGENCAPTDRALGIATQNQITPNPTRKKNEITTSPKMDPTQTAHPSEIKSSGVKKNPQPRPQAEETASNLPVYYKNIDRSGFEASEKVVYVPKSSDPRLKGMRSGDIFKAVIEQEIKASPNVPTPIRAMSISGNFKGALFVGEATLDQELKRVLFSFSKLRFKESETVYSLKASGLSPLGSVGLEGEYVSQTGKFFIAELASAASAGFMDSTIRRNQTAFGTYAQEPSLANSGKQASVSALSKTTERMAEEARTAPEYTKLKGYQEIQIIIQEDPIESNAI